MRHVPATAFTGQWASLNSIGKPATDCNVNSRLQNLNAGCGIGMHLDCVHSIDVH